MATASQALGVKYASLHVDPQGPGDKRPTARQIVEDEDLLNKLTDKVALITGCSSGIGVETARALYTAGVATAHNDITVGLNNIWLRLRLHVRLQVFACS